jgi:hypothetical protein
LSLRDATRARNSSDDVSSVQETLAAQAFLECNKNVAGKLLSSRTTITRTKNRVSRTLSRKSWQRKNFRGKLQKHADRPASAPRDAESSAPDSHVSRN